MFDTASLSKTGARQTNQDFAAHASAGRFFCAVVADGLGAYPGSDKSSAIAASLIISAFSEAVEKGTDVLAPAFISEAIFEAHSSVVEHNRRSGADDSGMTTVAVVITDGNTTVMSHVGDTRIYLLEQGKITYQSRDHSLVQFYVDRNVIHDSDIRNHPDRNKLLRVLGSNEYKGADIVVHTRRLLDGEGFILASDGWWEPIEEKEMVASFDKNQSSYAVLTDLKTLLELRSNEHQDNYSAIICKFKSGNNR